RLECPAWATSCCDRECRPTWANRRCRGPTQAAATTSQSSRTELRISLVWCHLQVIEIHAELGVRENTGAALPVRNRIDFVDRPLRGLGVGRGPRLAANPRLAVGHVLHAQLEPVPNVRLPLERRRRHARYL